MAAKKKTAPRPVPTARPSLFARLWAESRQYPSLALAVVFAMLTVFSIAAVVRFRNNLELGAIREPTASIFLAAITLTLTASYRWQRDRDAGP